MIFFTMISCNFCIITSNLALFHYITASLAVLLSVTYAEKDKLQSSQKLNNELVAANANQGDFSLANTKIDSIGTKFLFIFPSNNGGEAVQTVTSIDILNPNTQFVIVMISGNAKSGHYEKSITIGSMGHSSVTFNNFVNYCEGVNIVRCPDTLITINSTQPISVLANNFVNGQSSGDIFNVMPVSMAGNRYVLSLPQPGNGGYGIVYFLPVEESAKIDININGARSFSINISDKNSFISAYRSNFQYTLYANSDKKFVIIAAMTQLIRSKNSYDYGAFMPTPFPTTTTDCKSQSNDYHISMLLTTQHFFINAPDPNCKLTVNVAGNTNYKTQIATRTELLNINDSFGNSVGFESGNGMVQVTRYGGLDIDMVNGSYMDIAVSALQYVSGINVFFVPTSSNIITVIAYKKAEKLLTVDNKHIQFVPLPFMNQKFIYATASITSGIHTINCAEKYTVFVSGRKMGAGYGFVPLYNRMSQNSVNAPKASQGFIVHFTIIFSIAITYNLF